MDKVNIEPLVQLLEKGISPTSLAAHLDELDWEYIQYVLKDDDLCGGLPEVANRRAWLRELRQAIAATVEPQK